jgi:hypothetical protein
VVSSNTCLKRYQFWIYLLGDVRQFYLKAQEIIDRNESEIIDPVKLSYDKEGLTSIIQNKYYWISYILSST